MKKLLYAGLLFFELYAGTIGFLNFCLKIKHYNLLNWQIYSIPLPFTQIHTLLLLSGALCLVAALFLAKHIKENILSAIALQGIGLLVLLLLPLFDVAFWNIIAVIFIATFSVYRIFRVLNINFLSETRGNKYAAAIAIAAGITGTAYGIWLQKAAMDHLYLVFSDWTVYALAYRELGEAFFTAPWRFFNIGGHFNLLPNMIGAILFQIRPELDSLFFLNSVIIYSTVPCAYFAGRSCGVPPWRTLLFSLGLLFHFTLANLNICVFYGYHPNIYLLPLFLLFYGFYVQKKYPAAALFLILSLLVQETFAVFWFGFGLMLVVFENQKKKIAGAGLMLLMVLHFLFVTRCVMTWGNAENAVQYQQMFHYSNLGNTIPEILASPVTRPRVFFGELFAAGNFYFAGMLAAGFFASFFYSKLLVMILPALLGVFLLNGTDLSNICMQYQVEFFAVLAAASLSGLSACEKCSSSKSAAVLAATLTGMILCGTFGGRLPWGYYNCFLITRKFPDCSSRIKKLKTLIPPGKTILTTLGYQAHFAGRNPLETLSVNSTASHAEYIIVPFSDTFIQEDELLKIVQQIQAAKIWKCIALDSEIHNGAAVFARVNQH